MARGEVTLSPIPLEVLLCSIIFRVSCMYMHNMVQCYYFFAIFQSLQSAAGGMTTTHILQSSSPLWYFPVTPGDAAMLQEVAVLLAAPEVKVVL